MADGGGAVASPARLLAQRRPGALPRALGEWGREHFGSKAVTASPATGTTHEAIPRLESAEQQRRPSLWNRRYATRGAVSVRPLVSPPRPWWIMDSTASSRSDSF